MDAAGRRFGARRWMRGKVCTTDLVPRGAWEVDGDDKQPPLHRHGKLTQLAEQLGTRVQCSHRRHGHLDDRVTELSDRGCGV